jgi:hypothetical protein
MMNVNHGLKEVSSVSVGTGIHANSKNSIGSHHSLFVVPFPNALGQKNMESVIIPIEGVGQSIDVLNGTMESRTRIPRQSETEAIDSKFDNPFTAYYNSFHSVQAVQATTPTTTTTTTPAITSLDKKSHIEHDKASELSSFLPSPSNSTEYLRKSTIRRPSMFQSGTLSAYRAAVNGLLWKQHHPHHHRTTPSHHHHHHHISSRQFQQQNPNINQRSTTVYSNGAEMTIFQAIRQGALFRKGSIPVKKRLVHKSRGWLGFMKRETVPSDDEGLVVIDKGDQSVEPEEPSQTPGNDVLADEESDIQQQSSLENLEDYQNWQKSRRQERKLYLIVLGCAVFSCFWSMIPLSDPFEPRVPGTTRVINFYQGLLIQRYSIFSCCPSSRGGL